MSGSALAIVAVVVRILGILALLLAVLWIPYARMQWLPMFPFGWFVTVVFGAACLIAAPLIGKASIKATLR